MYLSSRARSRSLARSRARLSSCTTTATTSFSSSSSSFPSSSTSSSFSACATPPASLRSYRRRHRGTGTMFSVVPSTHRLPPLLLPSLPRVSTTSFLCFRLSSTSRTFGSLRASPVLPHTCNTQRCTPTYKLTRSCPLSPRARPCPYVLTRVRFFSFFAFSPLASAPIHPPPSPPFAWRFPLVFAGHRTHTNEERAARSNSDQPRRIVASVLRALTDFSISILFSRIRRNITARC